MCGIFGYVGKIEKSRAKACLDTLSHRGPDGYGLEELPGATLGQRRLAILDLSDKGSQPMRYKDRYWITYNGEIYNFVEIKKELETLGRSFKSDSDTEILVAAYDEWKEKCLDRLNGMWAFAIWDLEERRLFLSRDRFGKKPLFYARVPAKDEKNGAGFCFASEMKAIAPILPTLTPNRKLLADMDRVFYYESTGECVIEEIERFPAGHYGYVSAEGELVLTRFWNTLDHVKPATGSYEEQVKALRELFLDACAIRMRSDVTMGTALSGGLDSSAVFSTVSHIAKTEKVERASSDWQHAFNASFPGTPIDERKYAEEVARMAGASLETVTIDPSAYASKILEQAYIFEDLYITPTLPFMATYKAMRDKGVIVTLDGHGADELFGGYAFDYLHIIHDNLFKPKAIREVLDAYYGAQIDDPQFKQSGRAAFALKQIAKNLAKIVLGRKNHSRQERHPAWRAMDYFTQKLYISSHETVLPTLLRNYDRYSMASGIEIRMPFMDHRIVAFALSLPWQSKIRDGYTKAIIRDALGEFMPEDIAKRKTKIGFNAPMTDWLRGPLKGYFADLLASDSFRACDLVDGARSKALFDRVVSDGSATFADGEAFWKSIMPYLWYEGFYKRALANRV